MTCEGTDEVVDQLHKRLIDQQLLALSVYVKEQIL